MPGAITGIRGAGSVQAPVPNSTEAASRNADGRTLGAPPTAALHQRQGTQPPYGQAVPSLSRSQTAHVAQSAVGRAEGTSLVRRLVLALFHPPRTPAHFKTGGPPATEAGLRQLREDAHLASQGYGYDVGQEGDQAHKERTRELGWSLDGELTKRLADNLAARSGAGQVRNSGNTTEGMIGDLRSGFTARVVVNAEKKEIRLCFGGWGSRPEGAYMPAQESRTLGAIRQFFASVENFLAIGGPPANHSQARALAEATLGEIRTDSKYHGYEVVTTGHSMGGGMAVYAALSQEEPLRAVSFNGAEVSRNLLNRLPAKVLARAPELVSLYNVRGDRVANLSWVLPRVAAVGTEVTLPKAPHGGNAHAEYREHVYHYVDGALEANAAAFKETREAEAVAAGRARAYLSGSATVDTGAISREEVDSLMPVLLSDAEAPLSDAARNERKAMAREAEQTFFNDQERLQGQGQGLSVTDTLALDDYVQGSRLEGILAKSKRRPKTGPSAEAYQNVAAALEKLPDTERAVFRGSALTPAGVEQYKNSVGKLFSSVAFLRASTDPDRAKEFAAFAVRNDRDVGYTTEVRCQIIGSSVKNVAGVTALARAQDPEERAHLPAGTQPLEAARFFTEGGGSFDTVEDNALLPADRGYRLIAIAKHATQERYGVILKEEPGDPVARGADPSGTASQGDAPDYNYVPVLDLRTGTELREESFATAGLKAEIDKELARRSGR